MKSTIGLILKAVLLPYVLQIAAVWAQTDPIRGYVLDGSGRIVNSSTVGVCWKTSEWTPAMGREPCDPAPVRVSTLLPPTMPLVTAPMMPKASPPPPAARATPTQLNFSSDALFGFDQSVLNDEGKKMLSALAVQLQSATVDHIHVTGHTDRLGSAAYNQKLSERRANVVKDYLINAGVPQSQIDAQGMGETQPLTTTQECIGKQSAKVIACLQPDRRVDVELQGTKIANP